MARPGVSYIDVAKVATKLVEQSIRPSIEAIRRELGTGSHSTINHHLKQWRERQSHQLEAQQGLPDTLLIATKGLYEALHQEAEQKIKTSEYESQQAQALLQQRLDQQRQTVEALIQQKQAADDQINLLQQQMATLQSNLETLQQALEKKITEHELAHTRLSDKTADNERLHEQLQHAQHNLVHYRESLRQQREEEKQRYEAHIAKLEHHSQQNQAVLVTAQQTVATQVQQIQWLEQLRNTLEQAQHQLHQQVTEQALASQKQQLDYKNLQEKHIQQAKDQQALTDTLNKSQAHTHQLEINAEKTQGRLETVEQALKNAEDKITQLYDKNFVLTQEQTVLVAQLKQHPGANTQSKR